jgi:hypothetical protein
MDAATLYMIVTLPNGEQTTSTVDFSTLWKCEAKAEWFQLIERRKSPGAVTSYRCVEHEVRPAFYLDAYDRRGHPRDHFGPSSRQGCTAYKWVVHMRDRGLTARCDEYPRSSDAPDPEREPNLPNYFDMFGQPGVPKAQ